TPVNTDLVGGMMLQHMLVYSNDIVDLSWIAVFRRQPVVHGQDRRPRQMRDGNGLHQCSGAHHKTAAVQIDQYPPRMSLGHIQRAYHMTAHTADLHLLNLD